MLNGKSQNIYKINLVYYTFTEPSPVRTITGTDSVTENYFVNENNGTVYVCLNVTNMFEFSFTVNFTAIPVSAEGQRPSLICTNFKT